MCCLPATPSPRIHSSAAAGTAMESAKRSRRMGSGRRKYSRSIRCASFFVVRPRAITRVRQKHSESQCHYGVHTAEQQQRQRERHVNQQPAVQQAVELLLAGELLVFSADVFQVLGGLLPGG